MNNPISVCGLECDKCNLYLMDEDHQSAEDILGWFKKEGWRAEEMTVEEFMSEGKQCLGCRSDREYKHWSPNCGILTCCIDDRSLKSCYECPEFICEKLEEWVESGEKYAEGVERLKQLKDSKK